MNKYLPIVLVASLAACGGGGGTTVTPADPVEEPDFDPIPDLEEGESVVSANVTVINTAGGRYELSNESAGAVAGETAYRINVARGPKRNGVGGFGTAVEFEGANVTVYAGTDDGKQDNFAAIGESTVNAPAGNATFTGHYSVADEDFAATDTEVAGAFTNDNFGGYFYGQ